MQQDPSAVESQTLSAARDPLARSIGDLFVTDGDSGTIVIASWRRRLHTRRV